MMQEDDDKRNEMLLWCLNGEEKIKHGQKVTESLVNRFCAYLRFAGDTLERCNTTETILKTLFPDENYQYYHNILQYNAIDKASVLCEKERYDEAILELNKARYHAEEMTKYAKKQSFAFTAPLFNLVKGEKNKTDSTSTDVDDFIRCISYNQSFDPIREREDFKTLLST